MDYIKTGAKRNPEWLYLYITGNSIKGSGYLATKDSPINLRKIIDSIKSENYKGKVDIVVDICFSGLWVEEAKGYEQEIRKQFDYFKV